MYSHFNKSSHIIFSLLLITGNALAEESRFFTNQKSDMGWVDVTIGQSNSTESESLNQYENRSTLFQIGYSKNFLENHTFGFGFEYLSRDAQSVTAGNTSRISGIRSILANYKGGVQYEPATLIFGADANLSPGMRRDTRYYSDADGRVYKELGNNFKGYSTITPFVGVETYLDQVAFTGKAFMNYYGPQRVEGNVTTTERGPRQDYGIEGSFELPVTRNFGTGVTLTVARENGDPVSMVTGARNNQYSSKIFAGYKVDAETSVNGSLGNSNKSVAENSNETTLAVGNSRSL